MLQTSLLKCGHLKHSKGTSAARNLRGGSSKKKLAFRKEDACHPTGEDLSRDLHVRESASILGQVCHDIRQPVVALLACVELLTDSLGTAMTEEQRELIASMQASSRCMLELVDDSLALAFSAVGTLDFEPTLVAAIAEQNVARNRSAADRLQAHFESQRKEADPETVLVPDRSGAS